MLVARAGLAGLLAALLRTRLINAKTLDLKGKPAAGDTPLVVPAP